MVKKYDELKGKHTTRARISTKTLRILSGRAYLRDTFCDAWRDQLSVLGWTAFPVGDHYALIRLATIDDWPRIGAARIRKIIQRICEGDQKVFDEIAEDFFDDRSIQIDED